MDECVGHDFFGEFLELHFSREFSVDQEEGDFKEVTLFCKLFDGIASVLQNAFVSVNEADLGCAVDGVHIAWVVGTDQ